MTTERRDAMEDVGADPECGDTFRKRTSTFPMTSSRELAIQRDTSTASSAPDPRPPKTAKISVINVKSASLLSLSPETSNRTPIGSSVISSSTTGDQSSNPEESMFRTPLDDSKLKSDLDSFHNAFWMTIQIGHCFCVFPCSRSGKRYSIKNPRLILSLVATTGLILLTFLSILQRAKEKTSLSSFMVVIFYGMGALTSFLYIRLANNWHKVMDGFARVEKNLGVTPKLKAKLSVIRFSLLLAAAVEHLMYELTGLVNMKSRNPHATLGEYLFEYFSNNYNMVLQALGYSVPLAIGSFVLNIIATFLWNYNDLVIILVSLSIAAKFRLLFSSIKEEVQKSVESTPQAREKFWRDARTSFNYLSYLTHTADGALSSLVFVSFVNNLYFICMQLMLGFNFRQGASSMYLYLYLMFSFAFLVGRTVAVLLSASSVIDESRKFKDLLYAVPTEEYNSEVHRFLQQATSDSLALTGASMFQVRRSLLLTVAGTILTYEIVILQMNH